MKTIFVSSTFKDMHFERDIIHERVTPELNEYALNFGESVSFCDLRWGVNTGDLESDEGSKKVLSVCLDEIDKCSPYMVIIIGERYGWIPEQNLISEAIEHRRDFTLKELETSVTALEIEYGALCHPDKMKHSLIYFREFEGDIPEDYQKEDDYHAQKLKELKDRVRRLTGDNLKTYKVRWDKDADTLGGIDNFADMLTADIKQLLQEEWIAYQQLDTYERDQRIHWEYAAQKVKQFSARESYIQRYVEILDSGQKLLILKGESGCGKSTLMSRLAKVLQQDHEVCLLFAGITSLSSDTLDVLKNMVYFVESKLSWPHLADQAENKGDTSDNKQKDNDEGMKWADRLMEVIQAYENAFDKKLIFMLDAADQLYDDELRQKRYYIPGNLSAQVQMVISCLADYSLPYQDEVQWILPLTAKDKKEIIQGITNYIGRELEACVVDKILEKPSSDNPLYLSLLIQRLVMMNKSDFEDIVARGDGMSAISAHQIQLVEQASDSLEGVSVDILHAASERLGGALAEKAVMYIALSRYGLREKDLENLLSADGIKWNNLDFSIFVKYMRSLFVLREDGRLDFAHKSIRKGYQNICTDIKSMHQKILQQLDSLDENDSIRMSEIIYHCILADDKDYFIQYIEKYEDNEKLMIPATSVVRQMVLADQGQWLIEVYEKEKTDHQHLTFLFFLDYELDSFFDVTQMELQLEIKLYQLILPIIEKTYLEQPDEKTARRLALSYSCLGDTYDYLDDTQSLSIARRCYEQSLTYRKAALSYGSNKMSDRRQLANILDALADSYAYEEDAQSMEHGRDLYLEALALRKDLCQEESSQINRSNLAKSYKKLGKVYFFFDTAPAYAQSLVYYKEAEKQYEALICEDAKYRSSLASVYQNIALLYENLDTLEDLKQALLYYKKALQLRERLNLENGTAGSRNKLSAIYIDLADYYMAHNAGTSLDKAEDLYQKALSIRLLLSQERQTLTSMSNLAFCYLQLGSLYTKKGKKEDLAQAKTMFAKCIELRQHVATEKGTDNSLINLINSRKKYADMLAESPSFTDWSQAVALYKENIKDRAALAAKMNSQRGNSLLAAAYIHLASHYTAKNIYPEEAEQLLKKALDLFEQMDIELLNSTEIFNFSLCYQTLSLYYQYKDTANDMAQALEYAEKSYKICSLLYERSKTNDAKNILAGSLEKSCYIYVKLSQFPKAAKILAEAIQLREELCSENNTYTHLTNLNSLYINYCSYFYNHADPHIKGLAYQYMDSLLPSAEELHTEYSTPKTLLSLINVYLAKWNLEFCKPSYEEKKSSVIWLKKAEELLSLLAQVPSMQKEWEQKKEMIHYNYGAYYKALGDKDNLKLALTHYQNCVISLQARTDMLSKKTLVDCYSKIASLLDDLGGYENAQMAARYRKEQLSAVRSIYIETGLISDLEELQKQIRTCAWSEYSQNNNIDNAIEQLQEAVKLGMQLPDNEELVITYIDIMQFYNAYESESKVHNSFIYGQKAEELLAANEQIHPLRKLELQILIWRQIARAYKQLSGQDAQQSAILYTQKTVDGYEELNKDRETPASRRSLANSYEQLGALYLKQEDQVSREKALHLFEQYEQMVLALWKDLGTAQDYRSLAVVYEKKASVYSAYGDQEHYEKALELYIKELAIWKDLYEQEKDTDAINGLAITYHKLGETYSHLTGPGHIEQALACYEEEITYREQLVSIQPLESYHIYLYTAYEQMADCYLTLGGTENVKKSLNIQLDVVAKRTALYEKTNSITVYHDLAVAYEKLGEIYFFGYGKDAYPQAEDYYKYSLKIWEEIQDKLTPIKAKRGISSVAMKIGHCCFSKDTAEEKSEAVTYYSLAAVHREWLLQEIGTDLWSKSLGDSYAFLGQAYELSNYEDKIPQAVQYYEKARNCYHNLQSESYQKNVQDTLATFLCRLGGIYNSSAEESIKRKAYDCFMEAYIIFDQIITPTSKISSKDNYWMSMYILARSDIYEGSKGELVEKMLPVAEDLYALTGTERHKNFVGFCKYVLHIE